MPPPALGEDMPPPVHVVEPLGVDEPSVASRLIASLVGVVGVENFNTSFFFGVILTFTLRIGACSIKFNKKLKWGLKMCYI